ncbi:unnamed protein product [Ophioblennius macclurei]
MPLRASLHRKPSTSRWSTRHSKRKEVLSVNMISLPLADFRHISHIGSSAHNDSFGDLSFLKMGHNLLLQSSQSEQNIFLSCSPPPKPPRLNLEDAEVSESSDWSVDIPNESSQKRKKCNSMPLLDGDGGDEDMMGSYQRGNIVASGQVHCSGRGSVSSDRDGDFAETCDEKGGLNKDEDGGFSFSLDLGPSILNDVLRVMDKHN